jgi:hypothetical protein
MLVYYMQLLGLLRLVRINWVEQLTKTLTYLDFTSGATTWVSVECSLPPDGAVPRSVLRSIIVLLWPREMQWVCGRIGKRVDGVFADSALMHTICSAFRRHGVILK